jgi:hypothetical protein
MRGAEGVVARLAAAGKPGDAIQHAQPRHRFAPAGEDLVRIGLVADVPDDAVLGRIKDVVQRDRQLDRAEVGRQVAAGLGHRLKHEGAQLRRQLAELLALERTQLRRIVDRPEKRVARRYAAVCRQLLADGRHR